jgi:hypothetical protein
MTAKMMPMVMTMLQKSNVHPPLRLHSRPFLHSLPPPLHHHRHRCCLQTTWRETHTPHAVSATHMHSTPCAKSGPCTHPTGAIMPISWRWRGTAAAAAGAAMLVRVRVDAGRLRRAAMQRLAVAMMMMKIMMTRTMKMTMMMTIMRMKMALASV